MKTLEPYRALNNRLVETHGENQIPEMIEFSSRETIVYQLAGQEWRSDEEKPDGIVVGKRASQENAWWVCFVELKHLQIPSGLEDLIAHLKEDGYEGQAELVKARGKALGAQARKLIEKARMQLLSGIWHFCYHQRCSGHSDRVRHGDEHHKRWEAGRDLPPGMEPGCSEHRVAAVVILLQRSGTRDQNLLKVPPILDFVKLADEDVCPVKPIHQRVLVSHPNARYQDIDGFCKQAGM